MSRSSARSRRARDSEPWWAATASSPSRSASAWVARSAMPPGVHEDERRAVLAHERGDAVVRLAPQVVRSDRRELVRRDLDPEVERAAPPRLDDGAARAPAAVGALAADEEARHLLDRVHRRGEADALRPAARERLEPLEGEREVRASLVARHRVDLVHDDRLDRRERRPPALGGEEQVERLRGRHEHVRGDPHHRRAPGRGRVPRADRDAQVGRGEPLRAREVGELRERAAQVLLDVVAERPQRRDVEDARLRPEPARERLAVEPVDREQERREGLPGARRRRHEHVAPGRDLGPPERLGLGRLPEAAREPALHEGMERLEHGAPVIKPRAGRRSGPGRGL